MRKSPSRRPRRSREPRSKAIALAQLLDLEPIQKLVREQEAEGFTAPKSATCYIGKAMLRWVFSFRRREADGATINTFTYRTPRTGGGCR